jgi:hypothetical protein
MVLLLNFLCAVFYRVLLAAVQIKIWIQVPVLTGFVVSCKFLNLSHFYFSLNNNPHQVGLLWSYSKMKPGSTDEGPSPRKCGDGTCCNDHNDDRSKGDINVNSCKGMAMEEPCLVFTALSLLTLQECPLATSKLHFLWLFNNHCLRNSKDGFRYLRRFYSIICEGTNCVSKIAEQR